MKSTSQNTQPNNLSQNTKINNISFKQACDLIDLSVQHFNNKKYALAKIILINSSETLMSLLKEKILQQQESVQAQQYLIKALKCAEECKLIIESHQQQLGKQDPYCRTILDNLMTKKTGVTFKDIAGLNDTKQMIHEGIILPNLRPDIFVGIRAPHKGILFYGPPGNGKTLLAKAVATEARCTFFNLSASTLVSKHLGDGEKLMKALFQTAIQYQPCIIFIDEIDSILTSRSENEHEASRRLKTEFLSSFDGIQSSDQDRVVVIGATNRPQEIDHAALRRFTLRIFIDQPDEESREQLVTILLKDIKNTLNNSDIKKLVKNLKGYSASDIKSVVKEACMEPVRVEIQNQMILTVQQQHLRAVTYKDFEKALQSIRPTLTTQQLETYRDYKNIKQ